MKWRKYRSVYSSLLLQDLDYILKMDAFINQVKIKQEEGSRKAQTEQYVDALLEMTRQRDELKRKNEFLEVRIAELQEVNIQLQRKLDVRRILPQQSQQQFTLPLCAGEELADEQRKHSIFSFHTQDSVNGYDNACDNNCDFDQSEDTLMQFLQQLDSKQATQLYSLFSQIDEEHSNQIIQKMLTDSSQQSIFSFTQKIE